MEKARGEIHVKSLMSILIAGLFFGVMFVTIVPNVVMADENQPVEGTNGEWENDIDNPMPWMVQDNTWFFSSKVAPTDDDYCTELIIHKGLMIDDGSTVTLESVDVYIDGDVFPPFAILINDGGTLELKGNTRVFELGDDDYYSISVENFLGTNPGKFIVEGDGPNPSEDVEIHGIGGDFPISVSGEASFKNCVISDIEDQAISCDSDAEVSFDNVEITFEENDDDYPGVYLDGCKINQFKNTKIITTSTDNEDAVEFLDISESDNVEIRNCTFVGGSGDEGNDISVSNSEFSMYDCKFNGEAMTLLNLESSSTLHIYAPIVKYPPPPPPAQIGMNNVLVDGNSEIFVYWFLNATVKDQNENGVEGVKIVATSQHPDGPQDVTGFTNSEGKLFWVGLQQKKIYYQDPIVWEDEYSIYMLDATYNDEPLDPMPPLNINGIMDGLEIDVDEIEYFLDTRPNLNVSAVIHKPIPSYEGDLVNITATIVNIGYSGTDATVTFYDGDPDLGGTQIGIPKDIFLEKKGQEDTVEVSVDWPTKVGDMGQHSIYTTVDNSKESGFAGDANWFDNNWTNYIINLDKIGADFSVEIDDITFWNDTDIEVTEVIDGDNVRINATISNIGRLMGSAEVRFYNNGTLTEQIGNDITITDLNFGESINTTITWNTLWQGAVNEARDIIVEITSITYDMNDLNNKTQKSLTVKTYRDIDLVLLSSSKQSVIWGGDPATFEITITNYGRTSEDIDIINSYFASRDIQNWTIQKDKDQIMELNHTKTEKVILQVQPTLGKLPLPGDFVIVNITGESQHDNQAKDMISTYTTYGQSDLTLTQRTTNISFYREHSDVEVTENGKSLILNETSTIQAAIENIGLASTGEDVIVRFYNDSIDKNNSIGNVTIFGGVPQGEIAFVNIDYVFDSIGKYTIWVWVDPDDAIGEDDEDNNVWSATVNVKSNIPEKPFSIFGYVYDMDGKNVENAEVSILQPLRKTTTDGDGYYENLFLTQDKYFEGDELTIQSTHPDDPSKATEIVYAYSEDSEPYELNLFLKIDGVDLQILENDIRFYREMDRGETDNPIWEEQTSITATIRNRGTEDAENFYVNFTWGFEKLKGGNKIIITIPARSTRTIRNIVPPDAVLFMTPGGGFPPIGFQTVNVEISTNSDVYPDNNIASRTVYVKDKTQTSSLEILGTVWKDQHEWDGDAKVTLYNERADFTDSTFTDQLGGYNFYLTNYWDGDKIVLTAKSETGTGSLTFYAYSEDQKVIKDIVYDKYDVEITFDDKSKDTDNSLMVEYLVEIENTGNVNDMITLEINNPQNDWTVWLNETGNNTLYIDSGMTEYVKLFVKAPGPGDAVAGEKLTLKLKATSPNGSYDEALAYITINPLYLEPTINIIGSPSKSAKPGESVIYNFDVSNNGNSYDTIYMELSGDDDWASPVYPLYLNPKGQNGDSGTMSLKVTVPFDALEDDKGLIHVIVFGTSGEKTDQETTTTTAEKVEYMPSISITPNAKYTDPNIAVEYDVRVTNNGNGVSTIDLDANSIWSNNIGDAVGVNAGETILLKLSHKAPLGMLGGDSDIVSVIASVGSYITEPVFAMTTINYIPIAPEIEFEDGETSKTETNLIQGETKSFNISITNNGNFQDTMFTFLSGDVSWASPISSISLDANGEDIVKLSITVPKNVIESTEATVKVTTTSGEFGDVSNEIELTIIVDSGGYGVDIEPVGDIIQEINPGEIAVYEIKVTNTGKLEDNFILKVDENEADDNWNLDQLIINVGLIKKGDFKTVNVIVTAKKDTPKEDSYSVVVKAISQTDTNIISDPKTLTTKIHKPPEPSAIETDHGDPYYTNVEIIFSITDKQNTYTWNFDDGSHLESDPSVPHTFDKEGQYLVVLTAEDDTGAMGESTKSITVVNEVPIVDITKPDLISSAGINKEIEFEGNVVDNNGYIEYIIWDFGDGTKKYKITPGVTPTEKYSYSKPGKFEVTLTGKDDLGAEVTTTITITVENQAPEAYINVPEGTFEIDQMIVFNGSASSDNDSVIISYEWDFGDKTTGTGPNPTHTYSEKDIYDVKLTITDEFGEKTTVYKTIEILKPEETSYTFHWIISIAVIAFLFIFIVGILFGGREETFSHMSSKVKMGLKKRKDKEEKPVAVPTDIEEKLRRLEYMVEEKIKTPPPILEPPKKIETPVGILEEVREPDVRKLETVKEYDETGLLEEVGIGDVAGIEEGRLSPSNINELSEAFAATLVNLARGRDELAKIEERIADTLKDERDQKASEIRKITKDYELTQRKIDALEGLANMRRMQAGEEKIAAVFRGEIPEDEEEYGGLEEIEESPLGELEEIDEEEEYDDGFDDELMDDDLETLEDEEELEELEEEESVEEGEMAECGACSAMIPVAASKCPKCGAEFED